MKCFNCGCDVPDGAKFCVQCGCQFNQNNNQNNSQGFGQGYNQTGNLNQNMNPTGNLNQNMNPNTNQNMNQNTGNLNQGMYQQTYSYNQGNGQAANMNQPKKHGCLTAVIVCVAIVIGLSILVAGCSFIFGGSDDDKTKKTTEKSSEVTTETTENNNKSMESSEQATENETTDEAVNDSELYKIASECEFIKYEDLARKPDDYTGKNVMFAGQISQVLQEDNKYQYHIYLSEDEDGFAFYELPDGADRILENDIVYVFGSFEGLMTYETTRGDERTVPKYRAQMILNENKLQLLSSEFDGMPGEYTSSDGFVINISDELFIDVEEDGKKIISTIPYFIDKESNIILCMNDNNELDLLLTVDKNNNQIRIVSSIEKLKNQVFDKTKDKSDSKETKDTKESEKSKETKEPEGDSDAGSNDIVDKGVNILKTAVADALDDGDIVYMTAVDGAKNRGGTWVIDFSMDVFVDEYRDAFMDQLVGKIGDADRVALDMALKEAQIQINIKEDGTYTVTSTDFSSASGTGTNSEYYFADSDSRYLTEDDLKGLSKDDLAYARNEIYARHGYIFNDPGFNKYFNSRTWYVPRYTAEEFDDSVFNDFERKNIEFIKSFE